MAKNLILHCGAEIVNENDLRNMEAPTSTATHCPIAHYDFLELVRHQLQQYGYEIKSQTHATNKDGAHYFGVLEVLFPGFKVTDHALIVGLRNSDDKRFPAGIAAGSGVFVCDNLCFSGETEIKRRHTKHIMRDLPALVADGVSKLSPYFEKQTHLFTEFKNGGLDDIGARNLIVEAMKLDAITACDIPKVLEQWENPIHDEFASRTYWSLLNAFTEVAKRFSDDQRHKRTPKIMSLLEKYVSQPLQAKLATRPMESDNWIDGDVISSQSYEVTA